MIIIIEIINSIARSTKASHKKKIELIKEIHELHMRTTMRCSFKNILK